MARTRASYSKVSEKVDESKPEVNSTFMVRAKGSPVRIRLGPGVGYSPILDKVLRSEPVTIVAVHEGTGSKSGWGELADGSGWVALDFVEKV